MEVGWYPVSLYEMKNERFWRDEDIRYLVSVGRLGTVCSNNPSLGKVIYFESPEDRWRYIGLRKCDKAAYLEKEMNLAQAAGIPYPGLPWDTVKKPNLAFLPRRQPEPQVVQQAAPQSDGWETFVGVVKCIWFVLELLMLPFAILGMRDATQWWYGTGKYAGDRDDFV